MQILAMLRNHQLANMEGTNHPKPHRSNSLPSMLLGILQIMFLVKTRRQLLKEHRQIFIKKQEVSSMQKVPKGHIKILRMHAHDLFMWPLLLLHVRGGTVSGNS